LRNGRDGTVEFTARDEVMRDMPPFELACEAIDDRVYPQVPFPAMQPGGSVVEAHHNR